MTTVVNRLLSPPGWDIVRLCRDSRANRPLGPIVALCMHPDRDLASIRRDFIHHDSLYHNIMCRDVAQGDGTRALFGAGEWQG